MAWRDWLREPALEGVDIDGADRVAIHRAIAERKPLVREVQRETYAQCAALDCRLLSGSGARIELGAGVSYMRDFFPDVVLTDVVAAPHLDRVLDAQRMQGVNDESVRAFYGLHIFHHLSDPRAFFRELDRTLAPGGGCILVEPYFGWVARRVYPRLFATEHFGMSQSDWEGRGMGVMSGANQALSYIVFFRDRERFSAEFPRLRVAEARPLPHSLRFMLSGGLNFRQLAPDFALAGVRWAERKLERWSGTLALHHAIVLRKEG